MTDPRDDLDAWMNAQVRPLPPPPGTFELIRKRARRRKVTRAAAAAAGAAAVIAVIATVPRLVITQLNVGPGPAASGNAAGNTSSAGQHHHHQASASPSSLPSESSSTAPTAPPAAPPNFQPTSATFVGSRTGFVIGQAGTPGQCGPPDKYICTSIAGTGDYGSRWHGVRAPVAGAPAGPAGVSEVRFYNTSDGWAFGPQLWATHDGGQSWTRVEHPRAAGHGAGDRRPAGVRGVGAVLRRRPGLRRGLHLLGPVLGLPRQRPVVRGAGRGHRLQPQRDRELLGARPDRHPRLPAHPGRHAAQRAGRERGCLAAGDQPGHRHRVDPAPGRPCQPGAAQASGQPSGALLAATTARGWCWCAPARPRARPRPRRSTPRPTTACSGSRRGPPRPRAPRPRWREPPRARSCWPPPRASSGPPTAGPPGPPPRARCRPAGSATSG